MSDVIRPHKADARHWRAARPVGRIPRANDELRRGDEALTKMVRKGVRCVVLCVVRCQVRCDVRNWVRNEVLKRVLFRVRFRVDGRKRRAREGSMIGLRSGENAT